MYFLKAVDLKLYRLMSSFWNVSPPVSNESGRGLRLYESCCFVLRKKLITIIAKNWCEISYETSNECAGTVSFIKICIWQLILIICERFEVVFKVVEMLKMLECWIEIQSDDEFFVYHPSSRFPAICNFVKSDGSV